MVPERLPRGSGAGFGLDFEVPGTPWEGHFAKIFEYFFVALFWEGFLNNLLMIFDGFLVCV